MGSAPCVPYKPYELTIKPYNSCRKGGETEKGESGERRQGSGRKWGEKRGRKWGKERRQRKKVGKGKRGEARELVKSGEKRRGGMMMGKKRREERELRDNVGIKEMAEGNVRRGKMRGAR